MKLVTLARALPPHGAGDTRLVPDDIAERLEGEGVLSASEPWPAGATPPAAAPRPPRRATPDVRRPAGVPDRRMVTES